MTKKKSNWGFKLPELFGYSTFHVYLTRFDNYGYHGFGQSGWYLEWAIGPPMWNFGQSILLKKFNPTIDGE
jgi:hypothetical protein